MPTIEHFLYEHRSRGIPRADWTKIGAAADKMLSLVDPTSGVPGTSFQISVVRNDSENLAYQLGSEFVSINRIWNKKHYGAPKLPSTLKLEALSDLFLRGIYLAISVYAPKTVKHEIRSTGSLSGWKEARDLFEHATGETLDIDLMVANERLCKGFDTPLPVDGDSHLAGLAANLIGGSDAPDMGHPDTTGSARVCDIPVVSHSWFF